jgi:adenine-specific DNA-methyltransferase
MEKEKELQVKIKELEKELKSIKKQKKYGLVWEDKPEQIVEDCKNKVPILRLKEKKKGIDPVLITDKSKDENILIEGDNYHALSVLNYTHKEKIDVIYIDPPYNTGNQSWKYNNDYVEKDDPWHQ